MATIGILFLFFAGIGLGAYGATEYWRANRPDRERALERQVHALKTALEISRQAWAARMAMHDEADRLRHSGRRRAS